jgi:hypothetical protein
MSLLFENTETLPEDFYLVMMNLIKVYYERQQNLTQIYRYLDQNRERVDPELLNQIKSYIKPVNVRKTREQFDCVRIFNIIVVVGLLCIFPGGIIFVFIVKN